jgi:hypothetical protein
MLPKSPYHRHLSVTLPTVQRTRVPQGWAQGPFLRSAWPKLSAFALALEVTITEVPDQEPDLCLTNRQSGDTRHAEDWCRQEETLQQVSVHPALLIELVDNSPLFFQRPI